MVSKQSSNPQAPNFLDSLPFPAAVLDFDGKFQAINKAWSRHEHKVPRFRHEAISGKHITEILDDTPEGHSQVREVLRGDRSGAHFILHEDNHKVPVNIARVDEPFSGIIAIIESHLQELSKKDESFFYLVSA